MTGDPARVFAGTLTAQRLEELLRDIGALGDGVRVLRKGAARGLAEDAGAGLEVVRPALDAGESVQIRYEVGGETWIDTLSPEEGGVRIVRCPLPEPPPGD